MAEMATGIPEAHRAKDPDNGEVENDAGEGRKRVEDGEDEEEGEEEQDGENKEHDDDDEAPEEPSPAEQLEALGKTEAWQAIENYQKQYYPGGLPSHIDVNEVWGYLHKDKAMISNPRKHYFRIAIATGAKKRAKEDKQWRREGDETWRQAIRRSRLFCWYRPAAILTLHILDPPATNSNRIPDFLQSQMEELGLEWFLEEPSSWSPGEFWEGARFDNRYWIVNNVFHFGAKYSRPAININPFFRSDYLHPEDASSDSANSSPPEPNLAPRPEQTVAETETTSEVQQATSSAGADHVNAPNQQTDIQSTNNEASPTPSTAPKAAPVGSLTGSLTTSLNTPAVSPVPTQQHGSPGQGGRIHGSREGSKAPGKRKRGHGEEDNDEDEDMPDATRLEKPKKASDTPPTPMPPAGDSVQKDVKDLRKRLENIISSIREADFAPRKEVSEAAKKTEDGFKATRDAIEAIGKRLEVLEKAGASVNRATTAAARSSMRAKTASTLQNPPNETPSGGGARIVTEAAWMSRGGSYGYRAASVALEGGFPFNRGQQQQQQQGGFVAGEAREEMQRQQRRGREGERGRREVEVLDGEDGR